MMRSPGLQRRELLCRVVAVALVATTHPAIARDNDDTAKKPGLGKAEAGKGADNGDKPGKAGATRSETPVLTVVVTGDGKPVAQAEVQVKFPSSGGSESKQTTTKTGEVTFKLPGPGVARVRIIAVGWEGQLEQVNLKGGPQRHTFRLIAVADAGKAPDAKKADSAKGSLDSKR